MMDKYNQLYQNNLLYVFTKDQLKDTDKDYMVIVKDNTDKIEDNHALVFHYGEDFEKQKLPGDFRYLQIFF